ncbi:MAG: hypothetical protein V1821_01670 [bacterium]
MSEKRNCQACKQPFTIEPEDFAFYEKMQVPPPTWCPECRMRRRMVFMNERALYQAKCDLCNQPMISMFAPGAHPKVYCCKCWWSEKWDPMSYGREYDFSKPFFQQFKEMYEEMPELAGAVTHVNNQNSDYINLSNFMKNCYLVFQSDFCEDCQYSSYLEKGKNCMDVLAGNSCELCYDCTGVGTGCYRCFYSYNLRACTDTWFSSDLTDCADCFGCVGLRHKKFHFFNEALTKEEYERRLKEIDLGSAQVIAVMIKQAKALALTFPRRFAIGANNQNSTGDALFNCKNFIKGYQSLNVEDSKYCQFLYYQPAKDSYDVTMWGGHELTYECVGVADNMSRMKFCSCSGYNSSNQEYVWYSLLGAHEMFGCIALSKKRYCILNKQYSKEEFEALVPKIKRQMNDMPYRDTLGREYRYGEFFPPELSPFAYNETIAALYMPLSKSEALEQGFKWREPETKNYQTTIKASELPDNIKEVTDGILKEVIECAHAGKCNQLCSTAYKINPAELKFYRDLNLPLPRLCHNCRHFERLALRCPIQLWPRACMCERPDHGHAGRCSARFETAFAPDRPEIVYCEKCYEEAVG